MCTFLFPSKAYGFLEFEDKRDAEVRFLNRRVFPRVCCVLYVFSLPFALSKAAISSSCASDLATLSSCDCYPPSSPFSLPSSHPPLLLPRTSLAGHTTTCQRLATSTHAPLALFNAHYRVTLFNACYRHNDTVSWSH